MATAHEQLQALRKLGENWDGYDGAAPLPSVIDLAEEFASLIGVLLEKATGSSRSIHLSPTRTGGVLIEWEDPATEHEVSINPDRSIAFLHYNKATGHIDTRKICPEAQTVVHLGLLQELRQCIAA